MKNRCFRIQLSGITRMTPEVMTAFEMLETAMRNARRVDFTFSTIEDDTTRFYYEDAPYFTAEVEIQNDPNPRDDLVYDSYDEAIDARDAYDAKHQNVLAAE